MIDKLPPHAPESELGVLGCCLISPTDCLGLCEEKLQCGADFPWGAFYDLRNRDIFQIMLEMNDAQEPIDSVTLYQKISSRGMLEKVGGMSHLTSLQDATPSAANLSYFLETVYEKYLLRKMIQTCTAAADRAYACTDDARGLIDEIEQEVLSVAKHSAKATVGMKELVKKAIDGIEGMFARQGAISGMSTGLSDLDYFTDGLHPGEMWVIAGYPGAGKTSLAMNIAEHVSVIQKLPVGIFSLEMSAESLVTRFIFTNARVNGRAARKGSLTEGDFPKLTGAASRLSAAPIHIEDNSDLSIQSFRAKARRMVQQHGVRLFVVDYIQLLHSTGKRGQENRQQEVTEISRGIKAISMELKLPVIALSQLNDDGKLRESRTIGQDADLIAILKKQDEEEKSSEFCAVDLNIQKQRNGPVPCIVNLTFLKTITKFEQCSKVSDQDVP